MPASIDTRKAYRVRQHGDITVIYTWVNDERALVLVPSYRPGAPWYVVMDSAAYTWDDSDPSNVPTVARKAAKACEVLGLEPTAQNSMRVAGIIIDGLPDLIRMPPAPAPDYHAASFGHLELRADGQAIGGQDIRLEKRARPMAELDWRASHTTAPGDDYFRRMDEDAARTGLIDPVTDPLDDAPALRELRKVLEWYYYEKERQSVNRLAMAMDADAYDNFQWNPEDAQTLRERGQMPLVYNEVAPMCDWIIGTERRTRVDWKVLPRTEDDVDLADVKTKTLKYVSDINRVTFGRSRAFADAVKAGIGWLDDGARDDPTQDVLYSRTEDWRNVLWDSSAYELDLSDARYIFRWRWVDEDVALMMFPNRRNAILRGVDEAANYTPDGWEEEKYLYWLHDTPTPSNIQYLQPLMEGTER
jgi:hypothetical protein